MNSTKKIILFILLTINILFTFSQGTTDIYFKITDKADSLFSLKKFKDAVFLYTEAFKTQGDKGTVTHRYYAGCAFAMLNNYDSAFYNLFRAVKIGKYSNHEKIISDTLLKNIHHDERWDSLIMNVKSNFLLKDSKINKPVKRTLDTVIKEDQKYRLQLDSIGNKYGRQSIEFRSVLKKISKVDSINLLKVTYVLDNYGWLGPEEVGDDGNLTLFLVIQHANQAIQQKYLPMMREAVKKNNANPAHLALLEDRVLIGLGKKQLYGSQVGGSGPDNYFLLPLEDPENVDKRRKQVGLNQLQEYLNHWKIKWDLEDYKRKNP